MKPITTFVFLLLCAAGLFGQEVTWTSNRPENTLIKDYGTAEFTLTNEENQNLEIEIEVSVDYDKDNITTDAKSSVLLKTGAPYGFTIKIGENSTIRSGDNINIKVRADVELLHDKTLYLENELYLNLYRDEDFNAIMKTHLKFTVQI